MADFFKTNENMVRSNAVDLTARQIRVLEVSYRARKKSEGQRFGAICAAAGMSKPAVTRAADKLSKLGLMERQPFPNDRRQCLLVTTARGVTLMEKMQAGFGA